MGDSVEGEIVGSSVMIVGAGVGSSVIDTDPAGDAGRLPGSRAGWPIGQ